MAALLVRKPAAGAFAEAAGGVVDVGGVAQLVEQPGSVERRVLAAGFFVDQDQA
jgi:hypothetical protein